MVSPGIQRWLRPVTIVLLCAADLGATDILAAYFPVEHDLPLRNPGKGWVMIDHAVPGSIDAARSVGQCADGSAFEWYQNVAVLSTWALVEPERGVFDWALMDQAVDAWSAQGKAIHLRFSTEDFGSIPGCPRWLFDMGVPYQVRRFGAAELRFPDYSHPVYRRELDRFEPRAMISGRAYDLVTTFVLPGDIAPGLHELRFALLDENNSPAVRLAVDGDDGHQRYVVGRVEVAPDAPDIEPNSEIRLDGGSAQWFAAQELGPGTDALVSFRYEVTDDPARDLDSQDPGCFRFHALGADHARMNEFRWFDKAGQAPAWMTVLVSTDEAAPYRLVWEAVGGGTLQVSEARIETLAPGSVRRLAVENLDLAEGARIEQAVRVAFEHDRSQVRLPDDWQPYLRTRPEHVPLRPNTVYAVWFNAVARPQLWQGDYHYLHVRAPGDSAPPQHPTFRWTHRHTDQPVTRTYTFRTGPEEGKILEWGIKNGGAARISEIRIVELGGP